MVYLALSIIATTLIFVVFRFIGRQNVHTFQAIVVNYMVSVGLGLFLVPKQSVEIDTLPTEFFQIGLAIGLLFVINFWFMGRATQLFGVAPATILARISLVVPAFFSIWMFGEVFNALKALGLLSAILAIMLTLYEPGLIHRLRDPARWWPYFFPLGAFLGTGIIDSLFKVAEVQFLGSIPNLYFLLYLFGFAGLVGLLFICYRFSTGHMKLDRRAIPFGIVLGIVNFFAIYCLLLALSVSDLAGSVLFPINSVSIVALSTFISYSIFREPLNIYNLSGFLLAVSAILLITLA